MTDTTAIGDRFRKEVPDQPERKPRKLLVDGAAWAKENGDKDLTTMVTIPGHGPGWWVKEVITRDAWARYITVVAFEATPEEMLNTLKE